MNRLSRLGAIYSPKCQGLRLPWGSIVRWSSKDAFGSSEEIFKKRVQEREKDVEARKPEWIKRQESLSKRYQSWNPTRKLSRQQIQDIRTLKDQKPELKTKDLANYFKISPEAIRRILKSSWVPNDAEMEQLQRRAEKRKDTSLAEKSRQIEELKHATKRLSLGRVVGPERIKIDHKTDAPREKKLTNKFSNEGKVKYDSSNSHGYYNKKGSKKRKKMPYVQNVADVID